MKVSKVILVTAEHHPYHKFWRKLAEKLGDRIKTPVEIKIEDYVYLVEPGDKDELGMSWLPQILVELENNEVHWLLSQLPLDDRLQPDENKAIEEMLSKLKALGAEIPQETTAPSN